MKEVCGTCRWGSETGAGNIYCTVNVYWHSYNPPDSECDCRDFAGSFVPRYEPKKKGDPSKPPPSDQ